MEIIFYEIYAISLSVSSLHHSLGTETQVLAVITFFSPKHPGFSEQIREKDLRCAAESGRVRELTFFSQMQHV